MPIKDRSQYPRCWAEISRFVRFYRAANRCEWCGALNHAPHPRTGSAVVLTVAHLDHNPTHNHLANLAALCQRCHNRYDARKRAVNAKRTRYDKRHRFQLVLMEDQQ